jgi:hypothetical protein
MSPKSKSPKDNTSPKNKQSFRNKKVKKSKLKRQLLEPSELPLPFVLPCDKQVEYQTHHSVPDRVASQHLKLKRCPDWNYLNLATPLPPNILSATECEYLYKLCSLENSDCSGAQLKVLETIDYLVSLLPLKFTIRHDDPV